MISRLSASAAVFAVLATAGIAFTAHAQQAAVERSVASEARAVIVLPRVEITGHRHSAR